jgi:hypothetical protein
MVDGGLGGSQLIHPTSPKKGEKKARCWAGLNPILF